MSPRNPENLSRTAPTSIDFRPRSTQSRFGSFGRVFKQNPNSPFEPRIARLAVLYEDLRIELLGAALEPGSVPLIEAIGPAYRQQYFMRRAIGTLVEFREALDLVRRTPECKQIEVLHSNTVHYAQEWTPALAFFDQNKGLLKTIRNDVGGHFGEKATISAFAQIGDDYNIKAEIQSDSEDRTRLLLPFAAELSAVALLKHLPGATVHDRAEALMRLLTDAVERALGAVHFLVATVLWDRLG